MLDMDGDGFNAMIAPDGATMCPGNDCDDTSETVYPGAPEVCLDGIDQDCDTIVDGPVSRTDAVAIKALATFGANPQLLWTGSEFMAFWEEMDITYVRVGLDGRTVGDEMHITPDSGFLGRPSVIWSGSNIGLAYSANREEIFFVLLGPTGEILADPALLSEPPGVAESLGMTWTGSEFGLVWRDGRDSSCSDILSCETDLYLARVDSTGVEVADETRLTDVEGAAFMTADPVWTGSEYAMAWANWSLDFSWSQFYFSRMDAEGHKVGADLALPVFVSGIVWTGSRFGITYHDPGPDDYNPRFGLLDAQGEIVGDEVLLRNDPHYAGAPAVAWTGSGYGFVWSDGRDWGCMENTIELGDCSTDLYFSSADANGNIEWSEVRTTRRNSEISATAPSLVWTGSEFGAAWLEAIDSTNAFIYFQIISFCD